MADSVVERGDERRPDESPPDAGARPADEAAFAELRSLLVGPEQRDLRALEARLADTAARTRDVGRVLPDAIALRANDPQLTRALTPPVDVAITASVRRDPRPLADALFPAIGPAIRKAIVHTLASMMESLNRTVEQSLSWRAVQWRWTALRTGKPFAEIVLLNTLQYRVEQVFLIHRETGLLLQHVAADLRAGQEADQISAMLTAIGDFARDSFRVSGEEGLDHFRVGELLMIVEQGPHAILAGLVRGTPPASVRATFQDALETIHLRLGAELEAFRGDSAPFERARPTLEACLVTQFRAARSTSHRRWLLAGAVVLLAFGAWAFLALRDRQRWNDYLERLRAEPGIVILASGRRGGKFVVTGLRDPLAADPATFLAASGLPAGSVEGRWEPYQALHPAFVAARSRDLLRPPPGVALTYRDGRLIATGAATEAWIAECERLAPAIAGVRRFEYAGIASDLRVKQSIEATLLQFRKGRSHLAPDQDATLQHLVALLTELNDVVRAHGVRARVELSGHTDADGSDVANVPLSQARADVVLSLLRAHPLDALDFAAKGVGSSVPLGRGTANADKERNRRVSFRVVLPASEGTRP